jgi:hypothetical protein
MNDVTLRFISDERIGLFYETIDKSKKLNNVCYDIRGPVNEEAQNRNERFSILKLNIGNPVFSTSLPRTGLSR